MAAFFLGFVVFVVFQWVPGGERLLRSIVLPLARPFASMAQTITKRDPDTASTDARVKALEAQVRSMVVQQTEVDALKEEITRLRAQARFLQTSGYDSVGARVITRRLRPNQAELVIDRGTEDGLEVGQAVVAEEGVFIGKVASLTERTAIVQLLTDPRSRVAASLSGENRLLGVVEGRGNGAARMTYIPASQTLTKDQIIVSSGTEERVPAHLPLGLINAIEGKKTDPFVNAILEPLIPLDRLMVVSILRPSALRPE